MGLKAFFEDMFGNKAKVTVKIDPFSDTADDDLPVEIKAREWALFSAISLISSAFSMCEFRTFKNNKEVFGDEYYRLNYHANTNQTAAEWKHELMARLLFTGEVLCTESGNELIIADSFSRSQHLSGDTFSQISRDGESVHPGELPRREVMYCSYAYGNAKNYVARLLKQYDSWLTSADQKYKKSIGERGVFESGIIQSGDTKDAENQIEFIRRRFKKYFESSNTVMPLFDGEKYTKHDSRETGKEVDELNSLIDSEIKLAANAFHIPPALFRAETTGVQYITRNMISLAVKPPATVLCQELNAALNRSKGVKSGTRIMVDYSDINYVDVFDIAEKAEKLLYTSMFNVDELRRKTGEAPLNTEKSQRYILSKNFTTEEGGE